MHDHILRHPTTTTEHDACGEFFIFFLQFYLFFLFTHPYVVQNQFQKKSPFLFYHRFGNT